MDLKVYALNVEDTGYYMFHNHGIARYCHQNKIGEVKFNYFEISEDDLKKHGVTQEEFSKSIFLGEIIQKTKKDGNIVYQGSKPISAVINLKEKDIKKIEEVVENREDMWCENLEKMLEQHSLLNKDEYVLLAELRREIF